MAPEFRVEKQMALSNDLLTNKSFYQASKLRNSILLLANQIQKFPRMVRVSLKYHEPKPIISTIQLEIKQDFLTSQVEKYFGDKLFTF